MKFLMTHIYTMTSRCMQTSICNWSHKRMHRTQWARLHLICMNLIYVMIAMFNCISFTVVQVRSHVCVKHSIYKPHLHNSLSRGLHLLSSTVDSKFLNTNDSYGFISTKQGGQPHKIHMQHTSLWIFTLFSIILVLLI